MGLAMRWMIFLFEGLAGEQFNDAWLDFV